MDTIVAEFARAFRDFMYRDVMYVTGGATVLLSLAHMVGRLDFKALPKAYVVYLVLLSYVVGYSTLEFFSIIGIVTTSYQKPGPILSWLLHRWGGGEWSNMPTRAEVPLECLYLSLGDVSAHARNVVLRTAALKHVGSTMGSCLLLSAGILLSRGIAARFRRYRYEVMLGCCALLLGLVLCTIGHMKAVQQVRLMLELPCDCPPSSSPDPKSSIGPVPGDERPEDS